MEANQINRLIAQHIFNWTPLRTNVMGADRVVMADPEGRWQIPPSYATDLRYAFDVIYEMEDLDFCFQASDVVPSSDAVVYEWVFEGPNGAKGHACEGRVPMAICVAALRALGVDVEGPDGR